MKIGEFPGVTVENDILTGFYFKIHNRGIRGKMFEFSSPSYPTENFEPPFGAYLDNKVHRKSGVARKFTSSEVAVSDRTGVLYYYDKAILYGSCHGFGHDKDSFYDGFNFYNAFYPGGYFLPPYGENINIFNANQDATQALDMGSCSPLTVTEYNEMFGIVSKSASDVTLSTNTLSANSFSPIYSPKEVCPQSTVAVQVYYDEFQFSLIQGTTNALGATTPYNQNPIPTSLDNFDIKVNGRYSTTSDEDYNYVSFDSSGKPIPQYSYSSQTNKLNNALCLANLMETDTSVGKGTNGVQLIEAPDILYGSIGDQVSFAGADPWHYWHFTFEDNASTIPFYNNFNQIREGITYRSPSEGTLLFQPTLSHEKSYWQNRQCPDTVDFLPWTVGASIYACPSTHFDIPYYAAIRKFGFYGTRFLNSCKTLALDYPWSGVENASELPQQTEPLEFDKESTEPDSLDTNGKWSFSAYDNLLRTAQMEEKYSNMYAFNKGFFLWANYSGITGSAEYSWIISQYPRFEFSINQLYRKFQDIFTSGLASFSGNEPQIIVQEGLASTKFVVTSGKVSDLLFTNNSYNQFRQNYIQILSGAGLDWWQVLEDRYGYYIRDNNGINESFYQSIISGREKRMMTRYMENFIHGNPIDLFPLNHIYFSFDKSKDYLEHTGWSRMPFSWGTNSELPDVKRRFFEGAYGSRGAISGLMDTLATLSFSQNTFYYPGFFNDIRFNKMIPTPSYEPVLSGLILDTLGRKYSPSGWLAIGYNEIGQLDKNFSCFTPIFTQQPLPKVHCKIGQHPTLRCSAVDYHSIPEDKMTTRYPEIAFWCEKLKIFNKNKRNLYPLQYKWHRVKKDKYPEFLSSSNFELTEPSNTGGNWCALEGDSNTCTIIHPLDCSPVYSPENNSEDDYSFIQGTIKDEDSDYYYFCLASGRFGIRMSNPSELIIEDWLRFDVSVKNASNANGDIRVDFEVFDKNDELQIISISPEVYSFIGPYCGYQEDPHAIPESVIEQKIPPPNAGWGDVSAYRFVGSIGYVGATRSYKPSTLTDTRGLRESWGHLLDYGSLIPFSKLLNQQEGNLLYGYKHLPECENYSMPIGKRGIRTMVYFNNYRVTHWTLKQKAVATKDTRKGMKLSSLSTIAELYPPVTNYGELNYPNKGIGHWQWGNNLGSIKRFGKISTVKDRDIQFIGAGAPKNEEASERLLEEAKALIRPTDLAGLNCGYTNNGFGRNMLYYIEAFDRFYILCDPVKKKNVRNETFICPGLRAMNSAIQYFWLGQPNNTYLERRPMYGPYAYQWKVKRHNRDRNGNGISLGFYSMAWGRRFNMMFDAPSIYGLYVKKESSANHVSLVNQINAKRSNLGFMDLPSIRNIWWGKRGTEGTSKPYGDISFSCEENYPGFNSTVCDYVMTASQLAGSPDFSAYSCPPSRLMAGDCFDPCLSMRYGQGFFPGGKAQKLFNYVEENANRQKKKLRLVPIANEKSNGSLIITDELSSKDSDVIFRSPINTPHARITRGMLNVGTSYFPETNTDIVGISPCQDGGSEHCNFITPTLHLGAGHMSSVLVGNITAFNDAQNYASNLYSQFNIRGEEG